MIDDAVLNTTPPPLIDLGSLLYPPAVAICDWSVYTQCLRCCDARREELWLANALRGANREPAEWASAQPVCSFSDLPPCGQTGADRGSVRGQCARLVGESGEMGRGTTSQGQSHRDNDNG